MALIFLGVLIVLPFQVSASEIALTSSLMINGPNSPNLSQIDYQVWKQCWSLITSCNKSQKQFPSLNMHFS